MSQAATHNLPSYRLYLIESDMDRIGLREEYEAMVANGVHPNMADMLLSRTVPATKSDREFVTKERDRMSAMREDQRDAIVSVAQAAGVNTHGKTYNGQLGTYTDPMAWVSDTHDVRKVAEAKGLGLRGAVNVQAPEGPVKKKRIAKDILDRLEGNARVSDPELDKKCKTSKTVREGLRRQLTEKHTKKPSE